MLTDGGGNRVRLWEAVGFLKDTTCKTAARGLLVGGMDRARGDGCVQDHSLECMLELAGGILRQPDGSKPRLPHPQRICRIIPPYRHITGRPCLGSTVRIK